MTKAPFSPGKSWLLTKVLREGAFILNYCLLGWFLLAFSVGAQAQLTYTANNGAITITGYSGNIGNLTIPDAIDGLPVKAIRYSAFTGRSELTRVTIPNTVTSIGEEAFFGCMNLGSVIVPSSVTVIEGYVFADCFRLKSASLGGSSIGRGMFDKCTGLTRVAIGFSVATIGDAAFNGCTGLTNVTIPSSVATIGNGAFSSCSGLTSVALGDGVASIGVGAFYGCVGLTGLTIPKSVTRIGRDLSSAFGACEGLRGISVDVASQYFSSSEGVLFNKTQTVLIQYPISKIDASYKIPDTVTNFGSYAFRGCVGLADVTIPDKITSIGEGMFFGCSSLHRVYFRGNRPFVGGGDPFGDSPATVYYLPGTAGWGTTYYGRPTLPWNPKAPANGADFGVKSGNFGFNITGSTNIEVVVEACNDLSLPVWLSVGTNTLVGGSSFFSDPSWTNHPSRMYRFRSP